MTADNSKKGVYASASEHCQSDALFFFDGRPAALSLYQALLARMRGIFPTLSVRVQKSQISFYGMHLFAMVSLPRRKCEAGIFVSFGFGRRVDSPRISTATQPYPGRWTHHVLLSSQAQIDREFLDWLREAWEFSEEKRRRAT